MICVDVLRAVWFVLLMFSNHTIRRRYTPWVRAAVIVWCCGVVLGCMVRCVLRDAGLLSQQG
jgi:uncharacterized membrane protein YozB (DUF420 family)